MEAHLYLYSDNRKEQGEQKIKNSVGQRKVFSWACLSYSVSTEDVKTIVLSPDHQKTRCKLQLELPLGVGDSLLPAPIALCHSVWC